MARKKTTPTVELSEAINLHDAEIAQLLAKQAELLADIAASIAETVATILIAAESNGSKTKPLENFWLSPAQRDVLLDVPGISKSIKTKLRKVETSFTIANVAGMTKALAEALTELEPQSQEAVILVARHLTERLAEGIAGPVKPKAKKVKEPKTKIDPSTVYQFKITLLGSKPPIWRRIQVTDGTLDELHEHIQTSMGWTNAHLHHFRVGEQLYGDPMLMEVGMEEMDYKDSTRTRISKIVPKAGKRFSFTYEYDFGDGWEHDVLFEGCPRKEAGQKYPLCLEGERACPPEDVGGIGGFYGLLATLANPKHEQHEVVKEWVGEFDAEKFDAKRATREMKKGLPDWRSEM